MLYGTILRIWSVWLIVQSIVMLLKVIKFHECNSISEATDEIPHSFLVSSFPHFHRSLFPFIYPCTSIILSSISLPFPSLPLCAPSSLFIPVFSSRFGSAVPVSVFYLPSFSTKRQYLEYRLLYTLHLPKYKPLATQPFSWIQLQLCHSRRLVRFMEPEGVLPCLGQHATVSHNTSD